MSDHPLYAALYDRMCAPAEAAGLADRRRRLLAPATGRVLEVGAGTGHNLAHYPAAVTEVVALEPDGAMRRRLERRLGECGAPVRVVAAGIDDADLEPGSFDTAVSTLTLCTVPDADSAARRIAELLTPQGRLLFLEHVRSPGLAGVVQRGLTPAWKRLVPGCHLDRDVTMSIRRAGLMIGDVERFRLPLVRVLADYGVQGEARRPRVAPPVEPGHYPRRVPA
ncbi:MAG TPA: class I SAM-dependent methyltransferase [Acidimicrobiales bacterium]|nr:class I SAM-dependent methyltransferase [Acidimicrobiales bacterium]